MALNVGTAQPGTALPIAYGLVRATGQQIINQTDVLAPWQPGKSYSNGDSITDGTYQQLRTVPGFSGTTEPTFNTTPGGFTSDNGVGDAWVNAGSTNGDGTMYGFWVLGEGEWDGFDTLWNQGESPLFTIGNGYDIATGVYNVGQPNQPAVHFHSGTDGALGASLPIPSSNGPDQGCDNWIGELPAGAAILAQTYSRMAYYALKWLPQDLLANNGEPPPQPIGIRQIGSTLQPIGDWRALRCRIFDDMGNQTGYEWTTNPAWHYVDAYLRCTVFPRSEYRIDMIGGPPYVSYPTALPADALDKFDWGSIYEFSQDCDYVLANGRKRFEGNYAFAAQTTLAAITEQILMNSRGYQQEYAGKLFLNMDKARASVFTLTSQHQVPLTFTVDEKEAHQNANDYTATFLDILIPAIGEISSIDYVFSVMDYPDGQATIVTVDKNPVAPWDVIETGGNSNSLLNRFWLVNNILDDYTFNCQPTYPILTTNETGTGGLFGYPQSRFSKRSPELWHLAHATARGQIGP